MKKKHSSQSGFFNSRVLLGFVLGLVGIFLMLVGVGMSSGSSALAQNPLAAGVKIAPEVLSDTADGKSASVVSSRSPGRCQRGLCNKGQDARGWFVLQHPYSACSQQHQVDLKAFLGAQRG